MTDPDFANDEGPILESLTHRLSRCPRVFLEKPRIGTEGRIQTTAVVNDLLADMTAEIQNQSVVRVFQDVDRGDRPWLALTLVTAWLLHHPWFLARPHLAQPIFELLRSDIRRLAEAVPVEAFVLEPERREELARVCLKALGIHPRGESAVQAADRLDAIDSLERARVLAAAKRAEAHARRVREAMKRQKAKEAAAKVMRE